MSTIVHGADGNHDAARQHRKGRSDGFFSMVRNKDKEFEDLMNTKLSCKVVAENGAWLVPASERPKGWEKLGLTEMEC